MEYLRDDELLNVDGGSGIVDAYYAWRDFVNNSLDDFIDGFMEGWNSL